MNQRLRDLYSHVSVHATADLEHQAVTTDPNMLAAPVLIILAAVLLAMLPALTRALRIDPATMLRDE